MTEQVEQKTRTNVALKYPPRYDVIIFNWKFNIIITSSPIRIMHEPSIHY